MSDLIHSERFITHYYELDRQNRLRILSICNFLEEAAGLHADTLGVGIGRLKEKGLTWVLAKLRLQIERLPGVGEKIRVDTWPVSAERLQFRRDFLITSENEADAGQLERGTVIARAVSQWVVVGLDTRKLEKIPEDISRLRPENPAHAIEEADIRIPALPGEWSEGPAFPVRLSDIDQNNHVNNNRYADFILEAAAIYGAGPELALLDIMFRAEGLRGDTIGTRTAREHAGRSDILLHSLYRLSDGQELVRARTVWRGTDQAAWA